MLEEKNTPLQTLKRLPFYLHYLEELEASGIEYISTPKIAMDLGFNEMSVKKDFACVTTEKGKPKVGHKVINLLNDLKQDHICNVPKGLATKIPGIHAKMDLNDYKKMDKMLLFACFINSLTNERETLTSKILNSKLNEESKELFYNYLINNDIDYNFDIQGLIGKERGNM